MSANDRPISVTILGFVYVAVGAVGFLYHLREILGRHAPGYGDGLVEFLEIVAIVGGVFLLRGRNWARWLVLAWMAFHVAVSVFHTIGEFAVHAGLLTVIGWILFSHRATLYFRSIESGRS